MLMAANHEAAGGQSLPELYNQFLTYFSWVNFDLITTIPGMGCVALRGYVSNVLCQLGALASFGAWCALRYWRRKRHHLANKAARAYEYGALFVYGAKIALAAVSRTIFQV